MIDQEFINRLINEWNTNYKINEADVLACIIKLQDALLEIQNLKVSRDKYCELYRHFVMGILEKNISKELAKTTRALNVSRKFLEQLSKENLSDEHRMQVVITLKLIEDELLDKTTSGNSQSS